MPKNVKGFVDAAGASATFEALGSIITVAISPKSSSTLAKLVIAWVRPPSRTPAQFKANSAAVTPIPIHDVHG